MRWASVHPAKDGPVEIGIVLQDAPHAEARSYVYVDPHTGKVLEFRPYATLNAGSKLYYWALALHTGHVGGVVAQIVMLIAMLGVAAIGYTGIESLLRKTLLQRRNAAKTAAVVSKGAMH